MKQIQKYVGIIAFLCIVLLIVVNVIYGKMDGKRFTERYVALNRIHNQIQEQIQEDNSIDISRINNTYGDNWIQEYGEAYVPDDIRWIPLANGGTERPEEAESLIVAESNGNSYVWQVRATDGSLLGFIEYGYTESAVGNRIVMNIAMMTCFLLIAIILIYVYQRIIKPFYRLAEYPEKLSKGQTVEKLPETKNRYFGKFVWSMNMLNDRLAQSRKHVQRMEEDRQTMLSSIAHGVKTPVANIKLYANAIETGLYQESGIVNPKNAEIAKKIETNAMDIEHLVTELLSVTSTALYDAEPEIQVFYMKELAEQLEQEYGNRLKMHRIPYQMDCMGNPMLNSDKDMLFRILSQFIENAIKYGDGTGITVSMEKQEDGYYLAVKNRGTLLPEQEMPYIFKSFWRGSNASEADGSGIGLYISRKMAQQLGGDIYVKRWEDTSEMEFVIFLSNI